MTPSEGLNQDSEKGQCALNETKRHGGRKELTNEQEEM